MSAPTVWIACGVLRSEMETLHQEGKIGGRLLFLDSMLHMAPQKLETVLTAVLEQSAPGSRLVLVYGDCCTRMLGLAIRYRARRVDAINCAQLLLGRPRYRELMREKAFILLPEWTGRWSEVIRGELGLTKLLAPRFMREHRSVLVYLDTGLVEVPQRTIEECAAYTGLPWRVEAVKLEHLLAGLLDAERSEPAWALREGPR